MLCCHDVFADAMLRIIMIFHFRYAALPPLLMPLMTLSFFDAASMPLMPRFLSPLDAFFHIAAAVFF